MVAEYNVEEPAGDSKNKKTEKAGEGRVVCGKESHEAEEKACQVSSCQAGRHFVSSPATGSTVLSEMKTSYQVLSRPEMICHSSHCNAKD